MFEEVRVGPLSLHRAAGAQVVSAVFDALARGEGGTIVTANLDFVQRASEDPALARLYAGATLRVPDGVPVLWLARLAGAQFPERVAGSDLVWSLATRAAQAGRSIFLLGGEPGAAEEAARVLVQRFPGLRIAGTLSPTLSTPPSTAELDTVAGALAPAQPDLVFCAFGTPKQEQVAAALGPRLPGVWWLGCGISLSFIAGRQKRAPRWIQRLGFEWLHRTAQEPRRLAHRYLVRNLPFLVKSAATQVLGRHS